MTTYNISENPNPTSAYRQSPYTSRPGWQTCFYLVAQLVGGIGLSALLATILWPTQKRKPRNPLLVSMCFSWWLSTFPCLCILYYAGQISGPPPTFDVCITSAALTMAQSILVAATSSALIFHIWLVVRTAVRARFADDIWISRSTTICLTLPYALFVVVIAVCFGIGFRNPDLVIRATFYCIINDTGLTKVIGVAGTSIISAGIVLEVWTIVLLWRNRCLIRRLSREGYELDVSFAVRVCIFGCYLILGLCLDAMSINRWSAPILDLLYATFGIAVFIVFGTQPDIWRIWRHASRRIVNQLPQFNILLPRPALETLAPSSRRQPSSLNYLLSTPSFAQQHPTRQSRLSQSHSCWSGHHSCAPSSCVSKSRVSPVPSLPYLSSFPLPAIPREPRVGDGVPVIIIDRSAVPRLANDDKRTPTMSALLDSDLSHLDAVRHAETSSKSVSRYEGHHPTVSSQSISRGLCTLLPEHEFCGDCTSASSPDAPTTPDVMAINGPGLKVQEPEELRGKA